MLLTNECYRVKNQLSELSFIQNDEEKIRKEQLSLKIHSDELQILQTLIKYNDLSYISNGDELIKHLLYFRLIDNAIELLNSNMTYDVNLKSTINNNVLQNPISNFLIEFLQYLSCKNVIIANLLVAFIKKGVDLNQRLPVEVINNFSWGALQNTFGDAPIFLILCSLNSQLFPELDKIIDSVLQSRAYNIYERAETGFLSNKSLVFVLIENNRTKDLSDLLKNSVKINPRNTRTKDLFNPIHGHKHIWNEYPMWLAVKSGYWDIAEKILDYTDLEQTITEIFLQTEMKNVSLAVNVLIFAINALNNKNIEREVSITIIKVIDKIISKGKLNLHQLNNIDVWKEQGKTIIQILLEKILPYIDEDENDYNSIDIAWSALETIIKHSYESKEYFNTLETDNLEGVELTFPDIEDFENEDNLTIGQFLLLTSLWGYKRYWGIANQILKTDIDLNFNTPSSTIISNVHGEKKDEEYIILDLAIQDCNIEALDSIIRKMKNYNLNDMFVQTDNRIDYKIFDLIGFLSIPALIELKRINETVDNEHKIDIVDLVSKMPNAEILQEFDSYTNEQVASILKDIENTKEEGASNVFSSNLLNMNGNLILYPIRLENSNEISDYMYLNKHLDTEIIRVYNEIITLIEKGFYPNDELIKEQVKKELNEIENQNISTDHNIELENITKQRIIARNEKIMMENNIYIKSPLQQRKIDNIDQYRKNYPIHEESMNKIIDAIQKSANKLFPSLHQEKNYSNSKKLKFS